MTRSLSRLQTALLGITLIGAILLIAGGWSVLGERSGWGAKHVHLFAAFPDVQGLQAGAKVRIQGLDAGEVESIAIPNEPGQPVRLKLRLRDSYLPLIGVDAKVKLTNDNLLANKSVAIVPGVPGSESACEGTELVASVEPTVMEGLASAANKLQSLLTNLEQVTQDLKKSESEGKSIAQELTQATRKLNTVLTKVDKTLDEVEQGRGTLGKLVKNDALYTELADTLGEVKGALSDLRSGDGTIGKLIQTNEAYTEVLTSMQSFQRSMTSIKQSADAVKSLPIVRSYVVDPQRELVRPECRRLRLWYAELDLFEPGSAVLTDKGRERLDDAGAWLREHRESGSEVVVASYTAAHGAPEFAHTLTERQSKVVADYLRTQHSAHRLGRMPWSTRAVKTVGCGRGPSPTPETETMPPGRVEVLVFVPQG